MILNSIEFDLLSWLLPQVQSERLRTRRLFDFLSILLPKSTLCILLWPKKRLLIYICSEKRPLGSFFGESFQLASWCHWSNARWQIETERSPRLIHYESEDNFNRPLSLCKQTGTDFLNSPIGKDIIIRRDHMYVTWSRQRHDRGIEKKTITLCIHYINNTRTRVYKQLYIGVM